MSKIFEEAKKRIPSQKQLIIKELKEAGTKGITNIKLQKISLRYGGVLGNLYKEGYKIDTIPLTDGVVNYILRSEPTPETKKQLPKAMNLLTQKIDDVFGGQVTTEQLEKLLEEEGISVRYAMGTFK
jgi:hypothetical protein